MQREIKFRFWNKIARRFQPASKYAIDGEGKLVSYDYEMHAYDDPVDFSNTCIVAQQYTGLKDKNDVEIYEGDIVEIVGGLVPLVNRQKNAKYVIEYLAPSFTYKIINGQHMCGCGYTDPSIPEIIGNIFENPELLKE